MKTMKYFTEDSLSIVGLTTIPSIYKLVYMFKIILNDKSKSYKNKITRNTLTDYYL